MRNAQNTIYYGPPGTGKTFTILEQLRKDYEGKPIEGDSSAKSRIQRIIQERISSSRGLTWWQVIALALVDHGQPMRVADLLEHPFVIDRMRKSSSQHPYSTLQGTLQIHTVEKSKTVNTGQRQPPLIFDKVGVQQDAKWRLIDNWHSMLDFGASEIRRNKASQSLFLELLDLSKSQDLAEEPVEKRYRFVTFHQSFGYEEFVEGIKPRLIEEEDDDPESSDGPKLEYEIAKGDFLLLCDMARTDPENHYAMVIDEINRGNISKIFGELITLIEPDKRRGAQNAVSVSLAYSKQEFTIPPNVDIIGSMNTADRSLAMFDTALRRRFKFIPLYPEPDKLRNIQVETGKVSIDVKAMFEKMNERIEALYDREHTIGHAYFLSLQTVAMNERFEELKNIFRYKIIPLLEEYFFDDWARIQLVLADNQKEGDLQFIQQIDISALFGEDTIHGARNRYRLNEGAFHNPRAYSKIYE